jgi:hypothetical protein
VSAKLEGLLSSPVSADALLRVARRCLAQSPYRELRRVSCEHQRGRLILRGTVRCYYQKQLAQEALANLAGLADIINDIEVINHLDARPRRTATDSPSPATMSGGRQ